MNCTVYVRCDAMQILITHRQHYRRHLRYFDGPCDVVAYAGSVESAELS